MLHFLLAEPLGVAGIQPSEGLETGAGHTQNRFGVQMHTHPTSFWELEFSVLPSIFWLVSLFWLYASWTPEGKLVQFGPTGRQIISSPQSISGDTLQSGLAEWQLSLYLYLHDKFIPLTFHQDLCGEGLEPSPWCYCKMADLLGCGAWESCVRKLKVWLLKRYRSQSLFLPSPQPLAPIHHEVNRPPSLFFPFMVCYAQALNDRAKWSWNLGNRESNIPFLHLGWSSQACRHSDRKLIHALYSFLHFPNYHPGSPQPKQPTT